MAKITIKEEEVSRFKENPKVLLSFLSDSFSSLYLPCSLLHHI